MQKIFLLPLLLILGGCTTTEYWKHHSKPPSAFQNDHAFCSNSAIQAVPNIAALSQPAQVRTPQPTSFDTSCSAVFGTLNCRTTPNTGPASIFDQYQISPQAQMNAAVDRTRVAYVEACLVRLGWAKLDTETVLKAQQLEAQRKASFEVAYKKLNEEIKQFTEKTCKSEKYLPVTKLAPCSIPEIDAGHLSNSEYITQEQKNLFIDISRENKKMNDSVIYFYTNYTGADIKQRLVNLQSKKRDAEINNDSDLMSSRITWGEYNKINIKISKDYEQELKYLTQKR